MDSSPSQRNQAAGGGAASLPTEGTGQAHPADPAGGAALLEDETYHLEVDPDLPARLEMILAEIARGSGAAVAPAIELPDGDIELCALCRVDPAVRELPYRVAIGCTHEGGAAPLPASLRVDRS